MSKTATIAAAKRLDLEATKRLLADRPELLDTVDRAGHNLLHIACAASPAKLGVAGAVARARNLHLVKELIGSGAKVSAAPGGGLFAAGWWDDAPMLKLLIRSGAELDVVVGVTPFLASWCWRKFSAARTLALAGADVNHQDPNGKTALHHAIEKNFEPALLSWLVRHGASADIEDRTGTSALRRASRKRDKRYLAAMSQ